MPWQPEDADRARDLIRHENELMNHRLTWLATLHGFLFAALGFAWTDGRSIVPILAILGVCTSVSMLIPLFFSDRAIRDVVKEWDANKPEDYNGPDIIGVRPMNLLAHIFLPWLLLPTLLAGAWIVIWIVA